MSTACPESLLLIAGAGRYPVLTAEVARRHGVGRIEAIGFRGQMPRGLAAHVDRMHRLRIGQLEQLLHVARETGIRAVLLAGHIAPICLFQARFDALARSELRRLPVKSAHTLFGRIATLLGENGQDVLPATLFMGDHLAPSGVLGRHAPGAAAQRDLAHGLNAALHLGTLDIGQTVVVKAGMVLAAEAFEGTDRAIRRGARLGGRGVVVVKAARQAHDMRFDVPVVGSRTLARLRRVGASALGLQAGRTLMLDRARLVRLADRYGIALVGLPTDAPPAPTLREPLS